MAYLQCLQDDSHSGRFFWQSLQQASAIRSAETLLRWRNTLYEYGWNGCWSADGSRLADMAAVEASGASGLMLGLGQRCRRIAERLASFTTQLTHVEVIDREALPSVVESLLEQLAAAGVDIVTHDDMTACADADLGRVQQSLVEGAGKCVEVAGDDSIAWLQAQSLQMAMRWVTETFCLQ